MLPDEDERPRIGYAWADDQGIWGSTLTGGFQHDTYREPPRIGFLTADSRPRKDTMPGKPFSKKEKEMMKDKKDKKKKKGSSKPPMRGGY